MRVLHHYQLSASARFIRLVLAERGLVFLPKVETYPRADLYSAEQISDAL